MKEIKEPAVEQKFTSHRFDMTDRKKATVTGVNKVESSNATELILLTCLGKLEIRGTDLKISRFDVSDGSLTMTGNIDSVKYAAPKTSLVKRIFK
ncbi:MAG: YabP/YqfC family sporulation protein [Clostridiales bacterium]|nr:YabP/YqfC family sporulation protein [Clostridiales bacterium]